MTWTPMLQHYENISTTLSAGIEMGGNYKNYDIHKYHSLINQNKLFERKLNKNKCNKQETIKDKVTSANWVVETKLSKYT